MAKNMNDTSPSSVTTEEWLHVTYFHSMLTDIPTAVAPALTATGPIDFKMDAISMLSTKRKRYKIVTATSSRASVSEIKDRHVTFQRAQGGQASVATPLDLPAGDHNLLSALSHEVVPTPQTTGDVAENVRTVVNASNVVHPSIGAVIAHLRVIHPLRTGDATTLPNVTTIEHITSNKIGVVHAHVRHHVPDSIDTCKLT